MPLRYRNERTGYRDKVVIKGAQWRGQIQVESRKNLQKMIEKLQRKYICIPKYEYEENKDKTITNQLGRQ